MVLFGLGLGLAVGNWLGGRFADRSLFGTLYVTLIAPGIVPGSGGATIALLPDLAWCHTAGRAQFCRLLLSGWPSWPGRARAKATF